jgi:endonuclease/exonuclease/phosphatase family metal-dependent hydrolase
MEWFPGGEPTSTPLNRALQMSEAKEALLTLKPEIFCAQEVRDWAAFAEVTSVLPKLVPQVVSRHRDSPVGGTVSTQQVAIASTRPAIGSWSEEFAPSRPAPPRGFAFAPIPVGKTTLLVYSVHLKSNFRDDPENLTKREAAARQVVAHATKMEEAYGKEGPVVTVICGDYNTDPTHPNFSHEETFPIFQAAGFRWPWQNTPLGRRVTIPAKGQYPDASFDHILVRGPAKILSCQPVSGLGVSDHIPVVITLDL